MKKYKMRSFTFFNKNTRSAITITLQIFINSTVFAQSPSFKNYTENDGLGSSVVYYTFQDSQGYMWFATDAGVSKYNGYSFQNFTTKNGLSDNEVFQIFEDSKNRIWFLSFKGKICYWHDGKFYNSNNTSFLKGIDSDSYFTTILEDKKGTIWIGTERNGLVELSKDNTVKRHWNDTSRWNSIPIIYETNNGDILCVNFFGVFNIQKNRIIYDNDIIRLAGIPNVRYKYTKDDKLLFVKESQFYLFDHKKLECTKIFRGVNNYKVLNICEGKNQFYWICTRKGAYQLSGLKEKIYLPEASISHVFEDNEGNTWFSTLGNGIYFTPSLQILNYTKENGLPVNESYSLKVDRYNNLLVGHEKGWLSRIKGKKIETYNFINDSEQGRGRITSICETDKALWIASDFGLAKLENGTHLGYGSMGEKCVIKNGNRLIYGGALGFVICYEDSLNKFINEVKVSTELNPLKTKIKSFYKKYWTNTSRINRLFKDSRGRIWIGLNNGLKVLENDSIVDVHNIYKDLNCRISDIDEGKDNTIWISTYENGVFAIRNKLLYNFTEKHGLVSDICNNINMGSDNSVWIATNKGINRIFFHNERPIVDFLNFNNGLISNQINDICEKEDTIWAATPKGLIFFSKNFAKEKSSPFIHVTNFYVLGENKKYNKSETSILNYNENSIKLEYVGISYRNNNTLLYRYKFDKKDTSWHYTTNTSIEFPSLSPGKYEFQVEAKNIDGIWSEKPSIISFIILKPFWQSYWFYAIIGSLFIFIVWFVFSLRFKSLKRKELLLRNVTESKLKALRAQMDPHFIFNSLTALQSLVIKNENDLAEIYISKFAKLTRLILDNSRTEYISLSDEKDTLKNYLELQKLRRINIFDYDIEVDRGIDCENTFIPPMLAQPFIENALEHGVFNIAEKGLIKISFKIEDKMMVLRVEDNGIGFQRSMELKEKFRKTHKSVATSIIKERLELLKKKKEDNIGLDIADIRDENNAIIGTVIKIIIPFSDYL